ncbi:hypothetical protein [Nonomuraea africana]|uniref:Uncharacterized protein n=1 Tax=Nonomuraea africana TaxID=46171 RepID=A0ABR9KJA9_9ACTN|nr:hypothetical protein [Nonomuraea africana]MBE1562102.1 hypothetical protein [Nonomuraea africana]
MVAAAMAALADLKRSRTGRAWQAISQDEDGEPLAFSVIFNNYLAAPVKDVEDAIAIRLACFSRDPARAGGPPAKAAGYARETSWSQPRS